MEYSPFDVEISFWNSKPILLTDLQDGFLVHDIRA